MKIICIGHNYQDRLSAENLEKPECPVFLCKPDTALLRDNDPFYIPDELGTFECSCEVVIRIDKMVKGLDARFADRCFSEIGLGVDITAADLQKDCIRRGLPWDCARSFDYSSAISPVFLKKEELPPADDLYFRLEKNGDPIQEGYTGNMIFNAGNIIEHLSRYMTLKTGDLIYTGSPSASCPIAPGDRLTGYLEESVMFDFMIK